MSCSSDTAIAIWSPTTQTPLFSSYKHKDYARKLKPWTTKQFVSAGLDSTVLVWDLEEDMALVDLCYSVDSKTVLDMAQERFCVSV